MTDGLPPLPADVARMIREAEQQDAAAAQAGNMPVVEERIYKLANYSLGITENNPVILFDTPLPPGLKRHNFPFSWEAFDRLLTTLTAFREEHGPKAE